MIISAKDCWASAKNSHSKYFDLFVSTKLLEYQSSLTIGIYNFIILNHDLIRDGIESDFRKIQLQFDKLLNQVPNTDKKAVDAAIRKIFDYDTFSGKCKKRWCAYSLCSSLGFKTCPYCNLSYEITLWKDKDGLMRPSLDHFFDKDRFPLFAISLGNLVPSCHHCNSTFKTTNNFYTESHLNPLLDNESIKILLDINIVDARHNWVDFDTANIKLEYDITDIRQSNTIKTFGIVARYQELIDEIRDIAKNMVEYSTSGQQNLREKRTILRNVTLKNYRNRVFGKMILDMSAEYM